MYVYICIRKIQRASEATVKFKAHSGDLALAHREISLNAANNGDELPKTKRHRYCSNK